MTVALCYAVKAMGKQILLGVFMKGLYKSTVKHCINCLLLFSVMQANYIYCAHNMNIRAE